MAWYIKVRARHYKLAPRMRGYNGGCKGRARRILEVPIKRTRIA